MVVNISTMFIADTLVCWAISPRVKSNLGIKLIIHFVSNMNELLMGARRRFCDTDKIDHLPSTYWINSDYFGLLSFDQSFFEAYRWSSKNFFVFFVGFVRVRVTQVLRNHSWVLFRL